MATGSPAHDDASITGINVTPFVDVALVLLIIFMITIRIVAAAHAIPFEVPRAAPPTAPPPAALAVSVDADGAVSVDGRAVTEAGLAAAVARRRREAPDVRAVLAAHPDVSHGRVVRVIDLVRAAGVERFSIQVPSGAR